MVDAICDAAFKDDVDVWIVVVKMLGEAYGILNDLGSMELGDEEDVPWRLLPVEGEKAYRGLVVGRADPVREGGYVAYVSQRGCGGEGSRWWGKGEDWGQSCRNRCRCPRGRSCQAESEWPPEAGYSVAHALLAQQRWPQ